MSDNPRMTLRLYPLIVEAVYQPDKHPRYRWPGMKFETVDDNTFGSMRLVPDPEVAAWCIDNMDGPMMWPTYHFTMFDMAKAIEYKFTSERDLILFKTFWL